MLLVGPVDTGGADEGLAGVTGATDGPGRAAPQLEQNFTPAATGDPQFPQNPATYHLRKLLRLRVRAQHHRKIRALR
ncbi:MAG: hypothetical protein WA847_00295 [Terriglobales bacterium]